MKRIAWVVGFVVLLAAGLSVGLWLGSKRGRPQPGDVGGRTQEEWIERLRLADVEEGTKGWQELTDLGEQGLPVLLAARKDADVRVHRRAALALVKAGAPAVPGLIDVLPRAGDRVEVILVRIGKPAVPELEKALTDPERAQPAARVLGTMGERARDAVPALAALLADQKANVEARAEAAKALGLIGPETTDAPVIGDAVVGALTAALAGPAKVQTQAARSLGACGVAGRPAVAALSRLAKEKDVDVARAACEALGRIGAAEGALPLLGRVQQADAASAAAASALARLGQAARPAVGGLIASLRSDRADAFLARATLERLGTVAVPELLEALHGKDAVTRRAAADVLGLMGPRAAASAKTLEGMLKQDDPAVVIAAASALLRIEPERTKPILTAIEPLLTHKDGKVASAAAAVAGDLGPDGADVVAVLRKQLSSSDEPTVSRAALTLGRIRAADRETLTALADAAAKGPEAARLACVRALGRTGSKDALAGLLPLLKEPALRGEAAVALVRLDPAQGERVAAELADDLAGQDVARRTRALQALDRMRPPPDSVVASLLPLLGDDKEVPAVCSVLAECRSDAVKPAIPSLIILLSSRDAGVREWASVVLTRAGGDAARHSLLAALRSKLPETRAAAVRAFAGAGILRANRPAISAVAALLGDPEPAVQRAAAEALWRLGVNREDVIRDALPLLSHPRGEVRAAAARLVADGPANLVEGALCECLLDPDERVRAAASVVPEGRKPGPLFASLLEVPPKRRAAQDREAALRGEELAGRLDAARELILAKSDRREPLFAFLLSVLEGWDEGARQQAAETLWEMAREAKPALAALRRRVRRDDSDRVRRACEGAIRAIEMK